jgi:chromosome segregation ATPase
MQQEKDIYGLNLHKLNKPTSSIGIILYSIALTAKDVATANRIRDFANALEDTIHDYDTSYEKLDRTIEEWFLQIGKIALNIKSLRDDIEETQGLQEVNTIHLAQILNQLDSVEDHIISIEKENSDQRVILEEIVNLLKR